MARTVEELAAVRRGIRLQWMQPLPPAFPDDPDLADTSEDMLALLARQRLLNGRLLHALQSGNPDAINETRPRGPAAPRGTGIFRTLNFDSNGSTVGDLRSIGPISSPYIVRQVLLSGANNAAAGTVATLTVRLHAGGERFVGATERDVGPQVWPDFHENGSDLPLLAIVGASSSSQIFNPNTLIPVAGQFLTAFIQVSSAAPGIRPTVTVIIEEIEVAGIRTLYAVPAGRSNLNPSTRPPVPRLAAPPHPRGALIRVTQGGRILAERRIAWEALDASLRAKWFNQQVGEAPDPSITWLR